MKKAKITISIGSQKREFTLNYSKDGKFNLYDDKSGELMTHGILGKNSYCQSSVQVRIFHEEIMIEVKKIIGVK